MKPKTKKIVAQEGLIILGLICLGALTEISTVFYLNLTYKSPAISKQEELEFSRRFDQEKASLPPDIIINKLPADAIPVEKIQDYYALINDPDYLSLPKTEQDSIVREFIIKVQSKEWLLRRKEWLLQRKAQLENLAQESQQKKHIHWLYDVGQIISKGLMFFIFGYPFYWIIRFIFWAIKTLKKP